MAKMGPKGLSEKTKKAIVACYLETENKSEVARRFGVSPSYVAKILREHPEYKDALEEKHRQNTQDVLSWMTANKNKATKFMQLAIDAMSDPKKLEDESVRNIATAFGIIVDKFNLASNGDVDLALFQSIAEAAGGSYNECNMEQ